MNEISVYTRFGRLATESFVFPGGEIQVRFPGDSLALLEGGDIAVVARIQSSESLVQLMLATEAIDRARLRGRGVRTLVIPYFPYARQDRVMRPGEAFSLKVIAGLVNSLGYDRVVICDPHSDVTPALLARVEAVSQCGLIESDAGLCSVLSAIPQPVLVSPDAGASKKAEKVAREFRVGLVTATKHRDVNTGEITGTTISDPGPVAGSHAVMVDDICDGGRTFIELAKVLRGAGASGVSLYVTHGIFSKGLVALEGIDEVYTTDSFLPGDLDWADPAAPKLHVNNLAFNQMGIVL